MPQQVYFWGENYKTNINFSCWVFADKRNIAIGNAVNNIENPTT